MATVSGLRYDVKRGTELPDSHVRQLWAAHVWFHARPCVFSLNSLILSILFSFSYLFDHGEEGREKNSPGDSRVLSLSLLPSASHCIAFIPSLKPPIYLSFFSTLSVSSCHKSKAWICSALFCNPQLASSIGDRAAGNCLLVRCAYTTFPPLNNLHFGYCLLFQCKKCRNIDTMVHQVARTHMHSVQWNSSEAFLVCQLTYSACKAEWASAAFARFNTLSWMLSHVLRFAWQCRHWQKWILGVFYISKQHSQKCVQTLETLVEVSTFFFLSVCLPCSNYVYMVRENYL